MHPNIFFGVRLAAKFCEGKIILKNSKAQQKHFPKQSSTRTRVAMSNIFGFVGRNVYAVEDLSNSTPNNFKIET
jgi:hypothetical protein